MKEKPLVSAAIPVYNGADFLEEALESVFAQTFNPTEIIVIDDGSTDNSAEIVQAYPDIRYIYQENQGVSVARNSAIAAARGEYIAFLDADDIWKPGKLDLQIEHMLKNPSDRITATKAINFLEVNTELPEWLRRDSNWEYVKYPIPSTLVVHKSVFNEVGGFSPDYWTAEDTEWLWRVKDANIPVAMLDEVLTLRRYHGSNLSLKMEAYHKSSTLKIIRESVARQSHKINS